MIEPGWLRPKTLHVDNRRMDERQPSYGLPRKIGHGDVTRDP
jgi:hypothetical protein